MKRIFAAVLLCFCFRAAAQRLPEVASPEHYSIAFAPDLKNAKFSGDETIAIRVLKPATAISLNAQQIEIQEATLSTGNGPAQPLKPNFDAERRMVELQAPQQIA